MTKPFREFPTTKLPEHMKGWTACRVDNNYMLIGSTGHALAIVPGPANPKDEGMRAEIEQAVTLMRNAPEMLLLLETVIDQVRDGHRPDLGYLMGMSARIRQTDAGMLDGPING